METDERGRAPRRRLGTRRDDHSGRRQREHVSTLQGEISGRGPYQFTWLIFDDVSWTIARDWNSVMTFVWRPTTRAAYPIGIWARDPTTTADASTVSLSAGSEKPASVTEPGLVPEAST